MCSKKANSYFVTGTDTGIGKTFVTTLLITELIKKNLQAVGCKPIACGGTPNEDVISYQKVNSIELDAQIINPVFFELPISPHLAAKKSGTDINVPALLAQLNKLKQLAADYIFFEGIGGLQVPLNNSMTLCDLVKMLDVPLLVVVGIRVGCMNHAILTFESIQQQKLNVAGWIANIIDASTPEIDEHIISLRQWIKAPFLGTVPYQTSVTSSRHFLDLDSL